MRARAPRCAAAPAYAAAPTYDRLLPAARFEAPPAVLHLNDEEYEGKALSLRQQYFFVSAPLHDQLREFIRRSSRQWAELPDKAQEGFARRP